MSSQTHIPYSSLPPLELLGSIWQIDPVSLRRIFLLLTRNHYADPSYFGDLPSSFKAFKYDDIPERSSVTIINDYNQDLEHLDVPNVIIVSVGDITTVQKTVGSFAAHNSDLSGTEYTDFDTCSVLIHHESKTPDSALQLGVISKGFYQGMKTPLMSNLGLLAYNVTGLSAPTLDTSKGSSRTYYRVTLKIDLAFTSNWTTFIESHRIKRVNFDIKS